jgi:hypothetical protein
MKNRTTPAGAGPETIAAEGEIDGAGEGLPRDQVTGSVGPGVESLCVRLR